MVHGIGFQVDPATNCVNAYRPDDLVVLQNRHRGWQCCRGTDGARSRSPRAPGEVRSSPRGRRDHRLPPRRTPSLTLASAVGGFAAGHCSRQSPPGTVRVSPSHHRDRRSPLRHVPSTSLTVAVGGTAASRCNRLSPVEFTSHHPQSPIGSSRGPPGATELFDAEEDLVQRIERMLRNSPVSGISSAPSSPLGLDNMSFGSVGQAWQDFLNIVPADPVPSSSSAVPPTAEVRADVWVVVGPPGDAAAPEVEDVPVAEGMLPYLRRMRLSMILLTDQLTGAVARLDEVLAHRL
jgi:hypothetical protein